MIFRDDLSTAAEALLMIVRLSPHDEPDDIDAGMRALS